MVATADVRPSSAAPDIGVGLDVALVLAALATVTLGQGGYYRRVSTVAGVLLVIAAAAAAAVIALIRRRSGRAAAGA